ncbi:D-alanyl-D-alanine carboxypeptidase family protein [Virgibacillus kimchii]
MRVFICIISILSIGLIFPVSGHASIHVSGNNAILLEQSTGRVLFEKNAHEKASIASITKIMTAIIAIESGKMDEKAIASRKAIYTEGSSIYLEQGEKMKIEDLVYGLMLRSGNDAAVVIAEHIGGSEEGFVHLMNEKAKWLGMTNTNFDNPHGLDAENHYSTAYDMAILMQYAMQNEIFAEISGTTNYLSESRTYSWQNKNKLLTQFYEYCTGGKTGYTRSTGRTLVTSAEKEDMQLIAVTLNAPDDWQDHISMFEWGFDEFDMHPLIKKGEFLYQFSGLEDAATGYLDKDVIYPLTENERGNIRNRNFILKEGSLEKGKIIGRSVFYLEDQWIADTPIFSPTTDTDGILTGIYTMYKKLTGVYEHG